MTDEINKNWLNRKKQELENQINQNALKLKGMGRALRPGYELSLEHKALAKLLIDKGIISQDELVVGYLEEVRDLTVIALKEKPVVQAQPVGKKLLIPKGRG